MVGSSELELWQNGLMRAKGALQSFQELAKVAVDPFERFLYQEISNNYARMVPKIERKIRALNGK